MNVLLPAWAASSQSWNLQTSGDYQFDSNSIEVAHGIASLKGRPDWLDSDWAYRKKITINNATGTLADFQVKAVLNSGNFDFAKAKSDGADIRITTSDGSTLLPYWLEDYSAASSSGSVWFKIPNLPSGNTDFYIYYGNAAASAAVNGGNVFLTFDDSFTDLKDSLYNAVNYLTTPTYDDASGQAIHPDIYYNSAGWHGWEYWMANTPYTGSNDTVENPSMLVSHDGLDWSVPAGMTNPIIAKPAAASSYNSDPDLVYNPTGDYLMYYYREVGSNGFDSIKLTTSTDGVSWSVPIVPNLVGRDNAISEISPAIVRLDSGQYHMWYVGKDFGTTTTRPVYHRISSDGVNWQAAQVTTWTGFDGYSPWHINVRYLPTRQMYVMVISANAVGQQGSVTDLYAATSSDGAAWSAYSRPILVRGASSWDKSQIYRADFIYNETSNTFRLWYSARATVSGDVWHTGYTSGNLDYILNDASNQGQFQAVRLASTAAIAMNNIVSTDSQHLRLAGSPGIISSASILGQQSFTNNVVLEIKQRVSDKYYTDVSFGSATGTVRAEVVGGNPRPYYHTTIQDGYQWMWGAGVINPIDSTNGGGAKIRKFVADSNGVDVTPVGTLTSTSSLNAWHKLKYIYTDTGSLQWYHDGNLWQSVTDTTFLNSNKKFLISQGEYSDGKGGDRYIDYLFVRKYASADPTASLGAEETKYNASSPSLRPLIAGPVYNRLISVAATTTSSGGQAKFQLSNNDGATFYWWDGSTWSSAADSVSQANTLSDINNHLASFSSGQLSWRVYLASNGKQSVQVEPIIVQYNNDAQPPTGSLQINGSASHVATTSVRLSLTALDEFDATSSLSMQISNINDFSGADWQGYVAALDWTLAGNPGANNVYARFKDNAGNISEVASSSIVFDNQAPAGSLQINNGAAKASSTTVGLRFIVDDNQDSLATLQMRVSNNIGFSGADWQTATSSLTWSLSVDDGPKTVYAQWRDQAGNVSETASSSLILDTHAPNGSLQINSGVVAVSSTSVTLDIAVTDGLDNLANLQMQIANNSNFVGSSWQDAAINLNWSLAPGSGSKTIYLRLRDSAGNLSEVITANIYLDTSAPTGGIRINNGQAMTNQAAINIRLSVDDDYFENEQIDMQVADSSDFAGSDWQDYQDSLDNNLNESSGSHIFYVRFRDGLGNISEIYSDSIIFDNQAPVISGLSSQSGASSVLLSWFSNEAVTTSTISYGVSQQYGSQLTAAISGLNPSLAINGLLACSIYYYSLTDVDSAGNNSAVTTSSFTTAGCLGNASVTDQADDSIDSSGGQVTIGTADQGMSLIFPNNSVDSDVTVQIQALNQSAARSSSGLPSGYQSWVGDWYQVNVLDVSSQPVERLDHPIGVTFNYGLDQITGLQTSTLALFRYHSGSWIQLDNCQNDLENLQTTCYTDGFSVVALMGRPIASQEEDNHSVRSGSSLPAEAYIKPVIKGSYVSLSNGKLINGAWLVVEPVARLKLSAPAGTTGMAISRRSDFLGADRQTYQPEFSWTLCPSGICSAGSHQLYLRFYSAYGLGSDGYLLPINYQPQKNSQTVLAIHRDLVKEKAMLSTFIKKYGHLPKSSIDWQNFQNMVYGNSASNSLKTIKRDLNKEKAAISWFIKSSGRLPKTAQDWQKVNAQAYGG